MTWYEKAAKGHRARFPVPGKPTPAAGPVFPTREGAREWAVTHGHDRPDITTLKELVERWRNVKAAEKRVMPSYLLEVEDELEALATARKWVNYRDITMPELDKWKIEKKGIGTARHLSYLLAVLRWGWRQYGLPVDPLVLRHRTPQAPRKVMADVLLTDAQVSMVMESANSISPGVAALVHYLATYGPRPVTACTRRIRDIDFDGKTILVDGKRSGQWRHALRPETLVFFAAATKDRHLDDPLFLDPRSKKGWALNEQHSANALCGWYERKLGKPNCGDRLKGIYNLKRYAITGMLRRGIDPATVAKFTGHLALSQVLLYSRGNEETTRNALEKVCVPTPHTPHTIPDGLEVANAD